MRSQQNVSGNSTSRLAFNAPTGGDPGHLGRADGRDARLALRSFNAPPYRFRRGDPGFDGPARVSRRELARVLRRSGRIAASAI